MVRLCVTEKLLRANKSFSTPTDFKASEYLRDAKPAPPTREVDNWAIRMALMLLRLVDGGGCIDLFLCLHPKKLESITR